MDQKDIIDIARRYKEEITGIVKFDDIYLFGSYAKGEPRKHSDIDIAVVVEVFDDDYMKTVQLLWRLRRKIDVRIEPILLIKSQDVPGFYGEIKKTGILIN